MTIPLKRSSEINQMNMYQNLKSMNKIDNKLVAKLLKYRILFKDILTFLEFDYRDALLVDLGIFVLKN